MSPRKIIAVAASLLMLTACTHSGSNKPPAKMLIPENDMVEILTDTYLTAGMLDIPVMRETWAQRDSILNYIDNIKSHGYTLEQFDATLKYFFTDKPKRLSRLYDRVTANLLRLETDVMTEAVPAEPTLSKNLWPGQASYLFPEIFTRDPVWFDIPVETPGEYVLRADIKLFEDDRSLNPRVTVFFSYTDSTGSERRDYWREVRLLKSGEFMSVETRNMLDTVTGVRIRGWLLNHDNQPGTWEKHARIANISLRINKFGTME
ncbi:MAG: DUF4296 domain-containing protein [Bacteroidales bacterium]|nr:DUF4296 domain-containing protein [Bacteroidales bacterium]